MKMLLALIACISIVGCGDGGFHTYDNPTPPNVPGPSPTPIPVDETQDDINYLVDDENNYRLGLGQTVISEGLSCSVTEVVSGSWLSTSSPGYPGSGLISTTGKPTYNYLYKGDFNQTNSLSSAPIILLPTQLRSLYAGKNFKISCSGYIVVLETDYYSFSLNSDDGSLLSVDGAQVISNDNNHGMTLVTRSKFLRRGIRAFSLQYAQTGGGNFGLILNADGASIDPRFYYH